MGGTERWTNGLVSALHGNGYDVSWGRLFPSPRPLQYERSEEISTYTFYRFRPGRLWRLLYREATARLRLVLRSLPADSLIICTDTWTMQHVQRTGVHAGVGTSLRLIGMHHFQFPASRRSVRVLKRVYGNANAVVFLTEADSKLAHAEGIARATYIHNPQTRIAFLHNANSKIAVALGRLTKEKSFHYAVDAWGEIRSQHPDWQLHIYGDGPERRKLRNRIRRLGLQDAVKLMGPTAQPFEVLARSAIHVSTSQTEGFPLNILEASSVGVPTVAFNCSPGVAEQIQNGRNGILVRKNDIPSLVSALTSLISSPSVRKKYGTQALEDVARFDPERIWAQWFALISRVFEQSA